MLHTMQPLLALRCGDEARWSAIAEVLVRCGLELTDSLDEQAVLQVSEDRNGLVIRNRDDLLIQLSATLPPDDVAGLARVGLELTTLWGIVRSLEDSESVGVIASTIADDARNALAPVMFAADALAMGYPGAKELTGILMQGCARVESILKRLAPDEKSGGPTPICVTSVVSELAGTM